MNFYFVHENNEIGSVGGKTTGDLYDWIVKLTEKEPRHSGFIGAIDDTGKLRGTLAVNLYRGLFRNAVWDFIRKYQAITALEKLSAEIKERKK